MKYFLIIVVFWIHSIRGQNNLVPNPGFQNTSNGRVQSTANPDDWNNNDINGWKVKKSCNSCAQKEQTGWINLDNDNGNFDYIYNLNYNCSYSGHSKFVTLLTEIPHGTFGYSCTLRKDNMRATFQAAFTPNTWYRIRYKMVPTNGVYTGTNVMTCQFTTNNDQLKVYALDNFVGSEELVSAEWQGSPAPSCGWQIIERRFKVTTSGLNLIGFLAESGGFFLDDIEVFKECDNNYLIQNKDYIAVEYGPNAVEGANFKEMAGSNLTAGYNVGGSNGGNNGVGPVIARYGSYIIYTAANSVKLQTGFTAERGSHFHAANASCPNGISARTIADNYIPNKIGTQSEFFPGIKSEATVANISIFPNPVKNSFTYKNMELINNSVFTITDVLNRQLKSINVESVTGEISFDVSDFSHGIYFLNHYNAKGELISTNKFVKE